MAKTHEQTVAEGCIKQVKSKWGNDVRRRVGPEIYEALVAREVVSVVMCQALEHADEKLKASAADYMQEVATIAMRLADPDCA